jgi:hypothetical protein
MPPASAVWPISSARVWRSPTAITGDGSSFGRDLRRLIERVHDGDAETQAVKRLMARIKWDCQCNRYDIEKKVRDLAGENPKRLGRGVAFVSDRNLPPTNDEAERALRHAVIARRNSFGTRTDEGSRFYAAGLSVIDTLPQAGRRPLAYDLHQTSTRQAPQNLHRRVPPESLGSRLPR